MLYLPCQWRPSRPFLEHPFGVQALVGAPHGLDPVPKWRSHDDMSVIVSIVNIDRALLEVAHTESSLADLDAYLSCAFGDDCECATTPGIGKHTVEASGQN